MFEYLFILPPQQIPTPANVQSSLVSSFVESAQQQNLSGRCESNRQAEKLISSLLTKFNTNLQADVMELNFVEATGISADDSIHDEYFSIGRRSIPVCETLISSILQANALLFRDAWESSFTISATKLEILDRALNAMFSWFLGIKSAPQPRIEKWESRSGEHDSMVRWIRGHQIFAVLTQGLVAAFRELKTALQRDDEELLNSSVDLAVLLLHGSAASLEFTGDFPSTDYNDIIRPTMVPPMVPETFSGLLSVDHRHLVHLLREMKPSLDRLADFEADYHLRIASALGRVYDSHKFVCDRLVGKSPSLMMSSGSKKSGADQIEKFKHLRMRVFESAKNAETVDASLQHQH